MSNNREVVFDDEARNYLRIGIEKLTNAVQFSYGPKGKPICAQDDFAHPHEKENIFDTVKNLSDENPYIQMGIDLGKGLIKKMEHRCGDGSTTSLLLLNEIVQKGCEKISGGISPIMIKQGLEKGLDAIVRAMKKSGHQISTISELQTIATAAANGNSTIGRYIAHAYEKVGVSGVVTIEKTLEKETQIEIVKGMQFRGGYSSTYFCTNDESLITEFEDGRVLIVDKTISSIQEILPIVQAVCQSGQPLLIVAHKIEGEALSTLVMNKLRGAIHVCCTEAPGFGSYRTALLEDLSSITGATLFSDKKPLALATPEMLGSAHYIRVSKNQTVVVDGRGKKKSIEAYAANLLQKSELESDELGKEALIKRAKNLKNGVAVIKIGDDSNESIYRKALHATMAAMEKGVAGGGGSLPIQAAKNIQSADFKEDEKAGLDILREAAKVPMRQIITNCGINPTPLLEEILESEKELGFNAITERVEELKLSSVFSPVVIEIEAVINAISIATTILLSEALINKFNKEQI